MKGTPHSKKKKFELVSAFPDELCEGDLDPTSNKKVSHLTRCFYYSAKNVTFEVVEETDKMSLSERYGQALRATQEVAFIGVPRVHSILYLFVPIAIHIYITCL